MKGALAFFGGVCAVFTIFPSAGAPAVGQPPAGRARAPAATLALPGIGRMGAGSPFILARRRRRRRKKSGGFSYSGGGETSLRIDPNTAGKSELMVLPLVDAPTAQKIIEHRPYARPEDLIDVPGVGQTKYRIFKHLIEIRGEGEQP